MGTEGVVVSRLEFCDVVPDADRRVQVTELFALFRLPLYRYFLGATGNPADAEDLTQDCFFRLYHYLCGGNALHNPRLWLFHVAHNILIDRRKSARWYREVKPENWELLIETCSSSSLDPEAIMLLSERYQYLTLAMRKLTELQREVLTLKAEGLGYREIGEIMSLSTTAVAAHIRRALEKIKVKADA